MSKEDVMKKMDEHLDVLYPDRSMAVKKLRPDAILPEYHSAGAGGMDLRACLDGEGFIVIPPHGHVVLPTGLAFSVPKGFEMQIRSRSGTAIKEHMVITNQPGTVDSDYRGEVKLAISNLDSREKIIRHGDRIAQAVICPVLRVRLVEVQELDDTERGEGGFGSTGKD